MGRRRRGVLGVRGAQLGRTTSPPPATPSTRRWTRRSHSSSSKMFARMSSSSRWAPPPGDTSTPGARARKQSWMGTGACRLATGSPPKTAPRYAHRSPTWSPWEPTTRPCPPPQPTPHLPSGTWGEWVSQRQPRPRPLCPVPSPSTTGWR